MISPKSCVFFQPISISTSTQSSYCQD
jgi:hypothetical protein